MRHALIALAAAAGVAALAAPAAAQTLGAGRYAESTISNREETIRLRIANERDDGYLTASQAADLNARLNRIIRIDNDYRDDAFTRTRREDIVDRLDRLETGLRYDVAMNSDNAANDY